MQTIAIVGVGLIGGSFALAMRKAGFDGRILGVSSRRTLDEALDLGIVDEGLPMDQALPRADLVFLSQPIRRIVETLQGIDALVKGGGLVTDAGSTKAEIVATASRCLRRAQFLGGHPMAGKEKRGAAAADAELFAGRTWVITPRTSDELETEAARNFRCWVEKTGALIAVMDPAEHDRVVALTSHLPQLVSTEIAAALGTALNLPEDARAAGPALIDLTRLALSPFDIWQDILATNTENVRRALELYIENLQRCKEMLSDADRMEREFQEAARVASLLRLR